MATPQSTILPEHTLACIVIEADVQSHNSAALKQACSNSVDLLTQHQARYPSMNLGLCIAFGHDLWQQLNHPDEGKELKSFQPLGNGLAPATQHDLAIHIQSYQHSVNLSLAMAVLAEFTDYIHVADETHGFRLAEERGFDGFVDGTENPSGLNRIPYGFISENHPDAGGSYLLLQKYIHDLHKWDKLSDAEQASVVGRTKISNEELPGEQRLPNSHLGRVDLEENHVGLKIIRQSLPYGTASGEHGLMFIAYCAHLHNIEQQLLSMFGDLDGKTDLLLSTISHAKSGAYYFAPSVERLTDL